MMKSLLIILTMIILAQQSNEELIKLPILEGSDDGFWNNGKFIDGQPILLVGGASKSLLRFQINSLTLLGQAYVELALNWGFGSPIIDITVQDTINSSSLLQKKQQIGAYSNKIRWSVSSDGSQWGTNFLSPDISQLINHIISKDGWKYGDYVTIILSNTQIKSPSSFQAVSFEGAFNNSKFIPHLIVSSSNIFPKIQAYQLSKVSPVANQQKDIIQNECLAPNIQKNQNHQSKRPLILVIDDLQFAYLQAVSVFIVEKTLQAQADILLNVIPNNIKSSNFLKMFLQQWYEQKRCQIEIGQHGYTHQGNQYIMPQLSQQMQEDIILKGKNELNEIGIEPKSFTPPGGAQDSVTLQALHKVGFQTNIKWHSNQQSPSKITVIETIRLCNLEKGVQFGPDCIFKDISDILKEAQQEYNLYGYVCIAYHVQDFIVKGSSIIDEDKVKHYISVLNAFTQTNKYVFMTPQELRNWKIMNLK